ncbi:MAG: pilus assembly protein PilZ [Spirochaetaceae bacterium]|nr:pilus assembly protein PilZ [Spirochaetaceae bacterium]
MYSSSFQGAKIVANTRSGIINKLKDANNSISLRLSFKSPESDTPVTFFVSGRSMGYTPYGGSKDMALFTIQFTQRPPDDLIEIMGRLLDANINSTKRRDERVLITVESMRKLRILSKESAVFIQGVPRRCILRDISFSGAKLIMMGVAKFLVDREAALRMDFDDPRESFLLKGKFIRSEDVESRKELVALAILFDEAHLPMGYKVRLNDYLSQIRVDNRSVDNSAGESKSAPGKMAAVTAAPEPEAATGTAGSEETSIPAASEASP